MSAVLQERTEETVEVPSTQTIVLPVKDALMAGVRPAGAVVLATDFVIDCAEMAQMASDQRAAWAQRIDQLKAMESDFLTPAKKAAELYRKDYANYVVMVGIFLATKFPIIVILT